MSTVTTTTMLSFLFIIVLVIAVVSTLITELLNEMRRKCLGGSEAMYHQVIVCLCTQGLWPQFTDVVKVSSSSSSSSSCCCSSSSSSSSSNSHQDITDESSL